MNISDILSDAEGQIRDTLMENHPRVGGPFDDYLDEIDAVLTAMRQLRERLDTPPNA